MKIHPRLVAIAKNEAAYFIEWIAHHYALGFSSIRIYNNDSTDPSIAILGALRKCFRGSIFDFHDFPRSDPMNQSGVPQLNAFNHATALAREEDVTHMMFLDLDELLILKDHSIVETLEAHPDADSLSYHWMLYYGSLGTYEDRPMAERFPFAALNHPKNIELKSIARLSAIKRAGYHISKLVPGAKAFLSDGITPNWEGQPGVLREGEVNSNVKNRKGYFVAHFQTKSFEEYCVRRMKGCAITPNGKRNVTHRPLPLPERNPDRTPPGDAVRLPIDLVCPGVCARSRKIAARLRSMIGYRCNYVPGIKRFFAEQALKHESEFRMSSENF